jgi:CheY-like chemotaxis protein
MPTPDPEAGEAMVNEYGDDRDEIRPGDRVLLVVENDVSFARFLLDAAREKGFKGLITPLGASALALAREYNPDAVTLDIHLPDIDGWRVLERLKKDPATRHIPVYAVSTDDSRERALESGCLAFVTKPIRSRDILDGMLDHLRRYLDRPARHLVLIEPDMARRDMVLGRLTGPDVEVTAVTDGAAAVRALADKYADCVVVGPDAGDLPDGQFGLPVPDGVFSRLPVVLAGDGQPADGWESRWRQLADVCTVRRVHDPDVLLDLTTFFLHRPLAKLPDGQRQRLLDLDKADKLLAGKKVLIVDDDMRNIFALSTVLEEHDMVIVSADNGRDAIRILREDPRVDIVLMDIMMPEMDGMETMREIRKVPELKKLPIVAVTAKAMKGDREKCIEAGAWDYLSKPVDSQQLLAVLRAWLRR